MRVLGWDIGRGACSKRLDRRPGRVAGSGILSNAQWLERRLASSTQPLASIERRIGFAALVSELSCRRVGLLSGGRCPHLLGLGSQWRRL